MDGELITREWLLSQGFIPEPQCGRPYMRGTPDCNWWHEHARLELWWYDQPHMAVHVDDSLGERAIQSMRDLLVLLEYSKVFNNPPYCEPRPRKPASDWVDILCS